MRQEECCLKEKDSPNYSKKAHDPTAVLVFPCGNENAIEILDALSTYKDIKVYGGSSEQNHGALVFKNYIKDIPYIHQEHFINHINQVIEKYNISILFPTNDEVVRFLSLHKEKINCYTVGPSAKAVEVISDKRRTYEFFAGYDFCPKIYVDITKTTLPAFAKPVKGRLGEGSVKITTVAELEAFLTQNIESYIITEYLPGEEYSIDCFTDSTGEVLFCGPRVMKKYRGGIYRQSFAVTKDKIIDEIARIISTSLGIRGMWYFQCKKDSNGNYKLLEIAQKATGTMALSRMNGVNLPLLTIQDYLGLPLEIRPKSEVQGLDRVLFNRFVHTIDPTVVAVDIKSTMGRACNPQLIAYLLQKRRHGINIVGVGGATQSLEDIGISPTFFSGFHPSLNELIQKTKHERIVYIDDSPLANNIINIDNIDGTPNIFICRSDSIQMLYDWRQ